MRVPTPLEEEAGSESPAQAARGLETFASLRHRNFRYLWSSTLLMGAGQWIQQVTLGWLVYDLTSSSILLGLLNGLRALPFLVAGPVGGVAADRMDRRKLLLRTQWLLLAAVLVMGVVVSSGWVEVWHIFAFTLITGVAWSFNDPVRLSLVPNVVPREDLMNAVALNSTAFNLTKIVGPAMSGFLIALFGAGGNFFVQAAAYTGVLFAIFSLEVPHLESEARKGSALADFKEGLNYVWRTPLVLALMVAALVPRVFAIPYQTLMPVFQKDVLGVGPGGLGLLMAAPGVGAVLALLVLASVSGRVERKGLLLLASLAGMGGLLVLFAWIESFPLALVVLVGVGSCQVVYMATTHTLLQITIPDELRGRVMSIYLLDRGLMPIGAMLAGFLAHVVGAPGAVETMGLIVLALAGIVAWRMPVMREIRA